jgi:pimeloyl-ACP methyl ester carboxylesterase
VPGGGIVTGKLAADSGPTYQLRFKDGQVLLDQLAELNTSDAILRGHLDLERIGVVGWSTGGVNGAQLCLEEARIKAGVLLDPGLISYVPHLLNTGITKPFLVITGELTDGKTLFNKASGPAYWLHIDGSVHLNMGDLSLYSGATKDRRISQVRYAYVLSACKKWLLDEDDHLLDGPSPLYPEVATLLSK